jgi:hypothetical protein
MTSWLYFLLVLPVADTFCPAIPIPGAVSMGNKRTSPMQAVATSARSLSCLRMQDDVETTIPGTWCLKPSYEDTAAMDGTTFFLTLNPDRTVTFPPGEEKERDKRVRWKFAAGEPGTVNANSFALEVPKRSTLSTAFMDRSFQGRYDPEKRQVTGSVIDGEDEPEYVGKFEFNQISRIETLRASSVSSSSATALEPFPTEQEDWDGEVDESAWFDD